MNINEAATLALWLWILMRQWPWLCEWPWHCIGLNCYTDSSVWEISLCWIIGLLVEWIWNTDVQEIIYWRSHVDSWIHCDTVIIWTEIDWHLYNSMNGSELLSDVINSIHWIVHLNQVSIALGWIWDLSTWEVIELVRPFGRIASGNYTTGCDPLGYFACTMISPHKSLLCKKLNNLLYK